MKTFFVLFFTAVRDSVPSYVKLYFALLLIFGTVGGLIESPAVQEKANTLKTRVKALYEAKL